MENNKRAPMGKEGKNSYEMLLVLIHTFGPNTRIEDVIDLFQSVAPETPYSQCIEKYLSIPEDERGSFEDYLNNGGIVPNR